MKGHWIPPAPRGFIDRIAAKLGYSKTIPSGLGTDLVDAVGTLNDQITNLGPYNGLDSTSTTAALSAAQGKVLNDSLVQNVISPSFLHANAQTSRLTFYKVPLRGHSLIILTGLLTLLDSVDRFNTIFSCPSNIEPQNSIRFPVSKSDRTLYNGTFNGSFYMNSTAPVGDYYIFCAYLAKY